MHALFCPQILDVLTTRVRNPDKVSKIVTTLNLKIPPRELKSKDTRNLLQLVFSQWLSLSTCIIQTTIDIVPPPSSAQLTRIPKILYPDLLERTIAPKNKLEKDLWSCDDGEEAFVIGYVSKMFVVPVKELPENKKARLLLSKCEPMPKPRGRGLLLPHSPLQPKLMASHRLPR
jgi:translation elongation factor EF-G